MVLFFIIGIALVGMGVALLVGGSKFSGANASAPDTLRQIEAYGFAGEPVRDSGSTHPSQPFRSLAAKLGTFTQQGLGVGEHGIRRELLAAGMYDTDPLTIIGYRVLAALGLVAIWIWVAATRDFAFAVFLFGIIAAALVGWTLPLTYIKRQARQRTARIDYELPELIDLLVVTLEAGLSFLASLHMAASRLSGPLGTELRLMLQEQRMGLGLNEALEGMLRRCDTPSLRTFVRSIIQGEQLGVSTGQIMRNLAVEMRKRRRATAEERAQKAPIKMLFPLIFLIFPAMFVVLLGPAAYSVDKILGQ